MADIGLLLSDTGGIDISFTAGDAVRDDGLETAVLISLFSDARATEDQIPAIDRDGDLRGYWADSEAPRVGDSTGSLLWTIRRAKQLTRTLADAQQYALKSLQWLLEDRIATRVEVDCYYRTGYRGVMFLDVKIYRPDESNPVVYRYNYEWAAQALKVSQ